MCGWWQKQRQLISKRMAFSRVKGSEELGGSSKAQKPQAARAPILLGSFTAPTSSSIRRVQALLEHALSRTCSPGEGVPVVYPTGFFYVLSVLMILEPSFQLTGPPE